MAVISGWVYTDILGLLVVCLVGIITYIKWTFKYWERKKVPYVEPSIPFGNVQNPINPKDSFGTTIQKHYEESKKKGYKHVGLFLATKPTYLAIDLEYVKNILSADFHHFVDRGIYVNEKDDPLSAHLFAIGGSRWKTLRAKLTPTFTSGKMKMMFPLLLECGRNMTDAVTKKCGTAIDIKDWVGRYTTDVIGTCAFGVDCNSFENSNSEFRIYGKRAVTMTVLETVKAFFTIANMELSRKLGFRVTPKNVSDFFLNMTKDVVENREKHNIVRNDFLQLLMELRNGTDNLTIEEMTAQAFVFFIAGFETSSSTASFCLFELANNQDIQEKVRKEIATVIEAHDGQLTYEGIKEMAYLNQTIDETLRLHPSLPHLVRNCVLDYKIPGTDLTIEKDVSVLISVNGLHYDPEYHPNPEVFNPERFSKENRKKIKPFTYLPFGEGPRMCIGMRFGIMQTAVALALLLKNFRFTLSNKTHLPLRLNPNSFLRSVLGDIWLNVEKV